MGKFILNSPIGLHAMTLRFSIITPCLNRVNSVESSIQSVLDQGYSDVEHIIIDGGSMDGTLEILARYPHLKVLSEGDNGMYEALNKGLNIASGEIIGFLNADDLYARQVFQHVAEYFYNEKVDAISGKAKIFEEGKDGSSKTIIELSPPHPGKLVETAITGSTIFNAWFYRKAIIDRVGGFDSQYKISGDADLILRLALMGINYFPVDAIHYLYRQHKESLTFQLNSVKLLKAFKDHNLFIRKYISSNEISDDIKAFFNILHANTCLALSSQYRSEGKNIQSFLWKVRASSDISLPIFKYLPF